MTNKEAIEKLKIFYGAACAISDKEDAEALDLAINALEQNDRLKRDIEGLNNQIDDLCENLAWYINERNRLMAKLEEKEK